MKKTLFILCGQAFSGKSTLAREIARRYQAEIVGRDKIYFALEQMLALEDTPDEDDDKLWSEDLWPLALQGVRNHLSLGKSVVFDDVCLQKWRRDELRAIAEKSDAKVVLIYLDISPEILKERREKNKQTKERHDVPSAWLLDDQNVLEQPGPDENPIAYQPSVDLNEWFKQLESR